jgi:hypothetical protein
MLWLASISICSSAWADPKPPAGFTALFNGRDLAGWHGWAIHSKGGTPDDMAAMPREQAAAKIAEWTADARQHWSVDNGELVNDGKGAYLATDADYGDIELLIEYKTVAKADSGIYLRGTPQVQIWDTTQEGGKWDRMANKGSGGLFNNTKDAPGQLPLVLADKPFGEWNTFRIIQVGSRTTVHMNDKLVVDHAIMENYWDKTRQKPLPARGPILLQTHGGEIRWRNIFVRQIPADEANRILASKDQAGFESIWNGKDFTGWAGPVENYQVKDGAIFCLEKKGGTIYWKRELSDFVARLEFLLPPGGNNGLAIRYPGSGDTAYVGMCELQVLDTEHPKYAKLDPRQTHGSAYGMAGAHRGYLRPVGQWNFQQVTVRGSTLTVELNGSIILNTDLSKITDYLGNKPHPGKDRTSGYFGFAGHNDPVAFRNISIKPLK